MATETVTRPAKLSLPTWTQVPETKADRKIATATC
jgi:hypothetical protein